MIPPAAQQRQEAHQVAIFVSKKFHIALRNKKQLDMFLKDPEAKELVDGVVAWLANGFSPYKISTITGLNIDVIRKIRDDNPESIANVTATIATKLTEAIQMLAERAIETANDIPSFRVADALSKLLDKRQVLTGGFTHRIEHRNIASPEDLEKMFKALPSARVIEPLPEPQPEPLPEG